MQQQLARSYFCNLTNLPAWHMQIAATDPAEKVRLITVRQYRSLSAVRLRRPGGGS